MITSTIRMAMAAAILAGTALAGSAFAQQAAAPAAKPAATDTLDLYHLPPYPKYNPKRTAWGDPDMRGTWPIDSLGGLPFQRTVAQGKRVFLTEEEYQAREKAMDRSRQAAANETKSNKLGMGNWVEMTGAGRRTSLLVDPEDGRLPELTPTGKRLNSIGRSSWVAGQSYDWINDFDAWDRCVTRGFPASMLPFRYNNGIQIFQAPGYFVISLEMIHDARIIPLGKNAQTWPAGVTSWMGNSRGHWEGNTLVIETDHIRQGSSPLNMATIGVPPNNTVVMSPQARVLEKLTMSGPDSIIYEMTYSDPVIYTKPFTVRLDWQRNEKYGMFEYACHEGDIQVANYIKASRAQRAQAAEAATKAKADADAAKAKADADAATAAAAAADGKKKKK